MCLRTAIRRSRIAKMVRFIKSCLDVSADPKVMDKLIASELLIARLYFPVAVCLALGVLARCGLVPYAVPHEWKLFLVASLFLTIANARDLNYCIRSIFHPHSGSPSLDHVLDSARSQNSWGAGSQMQTLAAFAFTLGSVSLLNASLISIIQAQAASNEVSGHQYVVSFVLFFLGSGANNIPVSGKAGNIDIMRMLVSFQNVLANAALCVTSILMLPEIGNGEKNSEFQTSLSVILSGTGSVLLVMSSIVNYFYILEYCSLQYEYCENYNLMLAKRERNMGGKGLGTAALARMKDLVWSKGRGLWRHYKSGNRGKEQPQKGEVLSSDSSLGEDEELGNETSDTDCTISSASRTYSASSFSVYVPEDDEEIALKPSGKSRSKQSKFKHGTGTQKTERDGAGGTGN